VVGLNVGERRVAVVAGVGVGAETAPCDNGVNEGVRGATYCGEEEVGFLRDCVKSKCPTSRFLSHRCLIR
jgi:hypothetical protein